MNKLLSVLIGGLVGAFAFLVAIRLSPDALGMMVGIIFGVLAFVPTTLLVLAANRRHAAFEEDVRLIQQSRGPVHRLAPPPVVLLVHAHEQETPRTWTCTPLEIKPPHIVGAEDAVLHGEGPTTPN